MDKENEGVAQTKLVKHKVGGLGFLVKERSSKPCVTISNIVKGSTAEANGMLGVGDVLLEVNGKSLKDTEFEKALKILNDISTGSTVTLKVQQKEKKHDKESQGTAKNIQIVKNNAESPSKNVLNENTDDNKKAEKTEKMNGEATLTSKTGVENHSSGEQQTNGHVVLDDVKDKSVIIKEDKGKEEIKEKVVINKEKNKEKDAGENNVKDKDAQVQTESKKKCPFSGLEVGTKPLKPVKLKNWETGKETLDTLHQKAYIVSELEIYYSDIHCLQTSTSQMNCYVNVPTTAQ